MKMNLKLRTITVLFVSMMILGTATLINAQDWPMFGHDPENTGYSPSPGPSVGNLRWEYTTDDPVTSPAVVDGKVYVSSIGEGKVYCLDAYTGASIWNYTHVSMSPASSPVVAYNKVYISISVPYALLCLNADTGIPVWERSLSDFGEITSPTVARGTVYVGTADRGVLYFCADTGEDLGDYHLNRAVRSPPAVVDGMLWVVSGEGTEGIVEYLHPDGEISSQLEIFNVMIAPVAFENWVYVCSERAVHSLGLGIGVNIVGQNWEFPEFISERVTSSPTVADGEVYIGFESEVFCLDAYTGAPIWDYTTGFDVTATVVADGKVYICSDDGKIYCLNADTGVWIWEFSTEAPEEITTSYPAVADGKLYIGSSNGKVYCLGSTLEERVDALNARMSEPEIKFMELPGVRLKITSQDEYTISDDTTTNVWHGFKSKPWIGYSEEQKTEFLSTAQFRLTVDGDEIPLDHVFRYRDGFMWSMYYRVFPPGYFNTGNHNLVGEWHSMKDGVWTSDVREAKLRVK